jgi:hypothetical protein
LKSLRGGDVVLLYPVGEYVEDSLALLLQTYDRAYALAADISGREPSPSEQHPGYLPLAVVPTTCGPGCGRLGAKGIEISEGKFERIYAEFTANGIHDHLFFYELGRNFWFYGESSEDAEWEAIHTGFAVFFRDMLIRELNLAVAPINGIPYIRYLDGKKERWERFREESQGKHPHQGAFFGRGFP